MGAFTVIYHLIFYLYLLTSSVWPSDNYPISQAAGMRIITITCPPNAFSSCPEEEPQPFSSYSEFILAGGTVSSNCGIDTASFSLSREVVVFPSCPRSIQRTYSVRDSCGGQDSCTYLVVINDNTTPVLVCPSTLVPCDNNILPPPFASYTAFLQGMLSIGGSVTDNCSIDTASWRYIGESVEQNENCLTTVVRTYLIEDSCNNSALCNQKFIYIDITFPSFTPARDTVLYLDANCFADTSVANLGGLSNVADNCGILEITKQDIVRPGCTDLDTLYRIWTVRDSCHNAVSDTQFIRVFDTIKPLIDGPADTSYLCISEVPPPDTASLVLLSGCSAGDYSKTVRDSVADSLCLNNKVLFRIFTFADGCGNTISHVQVITIRDTLPPVLDCPDSIRVACDSEIPVPDPQTEVTAIDMCDGLIDAVFIRDSIENEACDHQKIIYRIYAAADLCGNTSRCIQVITVRDTLPPVMTCPADTLVSCMAEVPQADTAMVSATDQCQGNLRIWHDKDSTVNEICANKKTILRIYLAADACGNTSRCIQTILVNDQTPPEIICPGDTTVPCLSEVPPVNTGMVTATDDCGQSPDILHIQDSIADPYCPNHKTIFRIYQATDACGNSSRCVQIITIFDNEPPVIIGQSNTINLSCDETFTIQIPEAFDLCQGIVPVQVDSLVTDSLCPGTYKLVFSFTATDSCGNTGTRFDTVSFRDDTPPFIECPPDAVINCTELTVFTLDSFLYYGGQVSDECGIDSSSFMFIGEEFTEEGENLIFTRKFKISDLCGNTDSCEYRITTSRECFVDLALKKTIPSSNQPFFAQAGGLVPFCVTVYNQGFVAADSIRVIDYLPDPGSKIITPGWIDHQNGNFCIYLSQANQRLPKGGLKPGDSLTFCFEIRLSPGLRVSELVNICEVSETRDTSMALLQDLDSHNDEIKSNDTGGEPGTANDDFIMGDSRMGEDEDDHDPSLFYICQPLNCINKTNASVQADPGCGHCFKASELLTGVLLPDEFYVVTLYDSKGKPLPSNCVGREYLGQTLTYTVSLPACGQNSCWGKVTIEDKAPPTLDCSPDTVYCSQVSALPLPGPVPDNCSGMASVTLVTESWKDLGCAGGEIQGIYTRRLTSRDVWNNSITCDKNYYIRRINLQDIVCPRDTLFECSDTADVTDPLVSGTPTIDGIALWPGGVTCKLFVTYRDQRKEFCGPGFKIVRTWIIGDHCTGQEIKCIQTIAFEDRTPPLVTALNRNVRLNADPHECSAFLDIPKPEVIDCSPVTYSYTITYFDPLDSIKARTVTGPLPARIRIPAGTEQKVYLHMVDECNWHTRDSITVQVRDITPPNPVCKAVTQVTLDPDSCWGSIEAKNLDNGSHDNCCQDLHFAVAYMDEIEAARKSFLDSLQRACGKNEYLKYKGWYDAYLEDWINSYVFRDKLDLNACGSRQVVLRVYEACGLPKYDPHVFPCSPHAWYCYNTSWRYRVTFNQAFRNGAGTSKDCTVKAPWGCKSDLVNKFSSMNAFQANFYESVWLPRTCDTLLGNFSAPVVCQPRLYNDCMVQVLADDKQKPVCDSLPDLEVYCDGVPGGWAYASAFCPGSGDKYTTYPGAITRNGQGTVYGYYGGSYSASHDEHQVLDTACRSNHYKDGWQPVYCRAWLELDRFDTLYRPDPKQLFYQPVWTDKAHPYRSLAAKEFRITDNCLIDTVFFEDRGNINGCGEGWLERVWTIRDRCGHTSTCSQKIRVKHRSDFEVLFPEDREIGCTDLALADPDLAGRPQISDQDCEQIAVRFQDDTFESVEEACFKIVRTWTVIDGCRYEPSDHRQDSEVIVDDRLRANENDRFCVFRNLKDNGDGIVQYIQVIKIVDHTPPQVVCIDTTLCLSGPDCALLVDIPLEATDDCVTDLWFDLAFDHNQDGIFDDEIRKGVRSITGSFLPGEYSFKITAYDHCGNKSECNNRLVIRDCKPPTPYCLNGVITVIMPSTGAIEVWASDLDRGSYDNCTAPQQLKFSFDQAGTNLSRVFSCTDIPDGKQSTLPVEIWVTDLAGNTESCKTFILLQDNGDSPGGACRDSSSLPGLVSVKGKLATEEKEPVENVEIRMLTGTNTMTRQSTGPDGFYHFPDVQTQGTMEISAHRDDNPMNGVSTLDLLLIEKHIKGERPLSSPFKKIAADVDKNKEINVLDLVELRKLILGIYDRLPSGESWRFIPANYSFKDPGQPFDYPSSVQLKGDQDNRLDFTGIKVGDINGTASPHSLTGTEIRQAGPGLIFTIPDRQVRQGEWIEVPLRSPNFSGISGFQGTLHFEGLDYQGLIAASLPITIENTGYRWLDQKDLTFSWHHGRSMEITEGQTLFLLRFRALNDLKLSESIWINSRHTVAESYEGRGEVKNLSLQFQTASGRLALAEQRLFQNYPNPFSDATVIGLSLRENGKGKLNLLDVTGKLIKTIEKDWEAGYQEIRLEQSDFPGPGIYFYQFESPFFNASRKMILRN